MREFSNVAGPLLATSGRALSSTLSDDVVLSSSSSKNVVGSSKFGRDGDEDIKS